MAAKRFYPQLKYINIVTSAAVNFTDNEGFVFTAPSGNSQYQKSEKTVYLDYDDANVTSVTQGNIKRLV